MARRQFSRIGEAAVPVKVRAAKDRRPQFSRETLELFLELEASPQNCQRFKDGSRRLAHLLGLTSQWWTMNHVHRRDARPCHPPHMIAHRDWHTCREMRLALSAATGLEVTAPRRAVRARPSRVQ
jgi:hypothetical protein